MAKIRLGAVVGAASGSVGSHVFSHNRYGPYLRNRVKPTLSTTSYAQAIKSLLATASAQWGVLTTSEKLGWESWAQENPITDALGDKRILTGHAAYVQLNTRLAHIGATPINDHPILAPPNGLLTASLTYDIGPGATGITYTATPIGANEKLYMWGCRITSAGIKYIANQLRQFGESAAAQVSPFDFQTLFEARFGAPLTGEFIHLRTAVVDTTTGLTSVPFPCSCTVVDTTP